MNKKRSFRLWTVAIAVVAVAALAAARQESVAISQKMPTPEKVCPITFHLDPVTSLQARFAADTEKTNAMLAQDLADWRNAKALMPGYEADRKSLAEKLEGVYAGTYLHHPALWDESGVRHSGWYEILTHLVTVFPKATFIQPQGVHVYLKYVALKSEDFKRYNSGLLSASGIRTGEELAKLLENEIDFLANIKTVLAYAPYDDPMIIGNDSPIPHRKVCDPIY